MSTRSIAKDPKAEVAAKKSPKIKKKRKKKRTKRRPKKKLSLLSPKSPVKKEEP